MTEREPVTGAEVGWFLAIAFGLSWGIAGATVLILGRLPRTPIEGILCLVPYMFAPAIGAVLLERRSGAIAERLGLRWRWSRWLVLAWLMMPLVALATLGASLLLPGVAYAPQMEGMFARFADQLPPEQLQRMHEQVDRYGAAAILAMSLAGGLVAGATVNTVAALGEELGWRGFLHARWRHLGFWRCSLLTGFVWGVWHTPAVLMGLNYPEHRLVGVALMTLWCMLLAPLFTFVRERSGTVLAAGVMHGTLNATAGVPLLLVSGGSDLLVGITGLGGMLVLGALNVALYVGGAGSFEPAGD